MRAYLHRPGTYYKLGMGGVLAAMLSLLPVAAADPQPATPHVVTAPWALIEKATTHPRVQNPDAETLKWEPPPLPSTPVPPPLSEEQQQIVQATKGDKLPLPTWDRYVISNEWRHDVVFPKVAGLGGVYIGVATDQNFTMAAAARSELLVLMDYDPEVVNMHRIYQIFFKECATAAELRALFNQNSAYKAGEILVNKAPNKELGAKLVKTYASHRERVATYLFHVANIRVGQRHPTWLGDPEAYNYIRGLVLGGRFLAIQGDLNGTVALKSIGDTARALKLPVRIIYTSNAEGFFKYNPQFRDNLASLPHDEKTVMLRTFKHGMPSPIGDLWHFNLHQLDDFLARMELPGYVTIYRVMADLETKPEGKKLIDKLGVSYYDGTVPRPAAVPPKPGATPAAPQGPIVSAPGTARAVFSPPKPAPTPNPGVMKPTPAPTPGPAKPTPAATPGVAKPATTATPGAVKPTPAAAPGAVKPTTTATSTPASSKVPAAPKAPSAPAVAPAPTPADPPRADPAAAGAHNPPAN